MRRNRDAARPTVPRTLIAAVMVLGLTATAAMPAAAAAPSVLVPTERAPSQISSGAVKAAAADEFTFTGHGWGHGRGMGQYGALGYAVDHGWNHNQILNHFYEGTVTGQLGNSEISVELTAMTGRELVVTAPHLIIGSTPVPYPALAAKLQPNGDVAIYAAAGCAGPEQGLVGVYAGGIRIGATAVTANRDTLLQVCEASGKRAYRGSISVQRHAQPTPVPVQTAFNILPVEEYLRGVLPRESPASWGALGGGNGMQALKAQAVAARSYAHAGPARPSGAWTCDTTSCQVYGGAARWPQLTSAGPTLEAANTDAAVASTYGEVRQRPGSAAAVRTEFSSSTGGYTAGGAFTAVPDAGDATSLNPNHNWTATYSGAEVAAKLNVPGVRSVTVTARNGLGDMGGRVTQVVVVDDAGTARTYSGTDFRSKLGTDRFKSDWFSVAGTTTADAQAVVKALYQDLLGRQPDPTGLSGWSSALMSGTSQSVLVATLTRSDEYIWSRVTKAYREVLGREPEQVGAASWLNAIKAGQATVDDVQRRFYDSGEYFAASGGTPDGYVRRLYTTVLRREASPADVSSWVTAYHQNGRARVVDAIWFSGEAASVRAGDYYRTFLGRGPDPSGQAAWAQVLLSHGEGAVRVGIAGSLEYRGRAIARYP